MAMIDLTKPYIMVDNIITIKIDDVEKLQIKFKLYGCINVTDVSYTLNGTRYTLDSTNAYCNHLVPEGAEQTTFTVVALCVRICTPYELEHIAHALVHLDGPHYRGSTAAMRKLHLLESITIARMFLIHSSSYA